MALNPIDYIILSIVALIVIGVIIFMINERKKGKGRCSCCPLSSSCEKNRNKK